MGATLSDLVYVDAVGAGGQHQQRLGAVVALVSTVFRVVCPRDGDEDQRAGDLAHFDTEGLGRLGGSAGGVAEHSHLAADGEAGERGTHTRDRRMCCEVNHVGTIWVRSAVGRRDVPLYLR